ncbi:MAG: hypothetical protein AAFX55_00615 [Bacteroidota bacterium]
MKRIVIIALLALTNSCVKNESVPIVFEELIVLANDLEGNLYQTDAIHAFAANDMSNNDHVNIFAVVEDGATDIKFYESDYPNIDAQNFYSYRLMEIQPTVTVDAKVKEFRHTFLRDEWIIMTYKHEGKIKLSSPIRINNLFQQTQYMADIGINQEQSGMPIFDWNVQSYDDNAFFFEIMKGDTSEVLSLTFTNESRFQYFDLANVTLNLSTASPPNLVIGNDYEFMVLDVGLDHWINTVYHYNFIAE